MVATRNSPWRWRTLVVGLWVCACLAVAGCGDGSIGPPGADGADGADGGPGPEGPAGPPGPNVIDATKVSEDFLADLHVESEITGVSVSSPPVVTFTLHTEAGVPIIGIVAFWNESSRFVRFTFAKLVPGMDGDPDSWVNYVRDASSGEPDYDTGSSLVDHGDGSYTFTFATDVTNVPGIPWEPMRTHRLAGQLGSRSVPLQAQNFVHDFVPAGGPFPLMRNIATMSSCNECHDGLVFHGRRFRVEYCVTCHNPDLAQGDGNFSYMIHRIHSAGTFTHLGTRGGTRPPADFSEVTFPQDLRNCRKCHNGDDAATPQGDNWMTRVNRAACGGCHTAIENLTHPIVPNPSNSACHFCHGPEASLTPERVHITPNATPNNPLLLPGENGGVDQREIAYELIEATVNGMNGDITVRFKILSDGTPLDLTNLPADLLAGNRWPSFLLAWALPHPGVDSPKDYNNDGREGGVAPSIGLGDLVDGVGGTMAFDMGSGVNTAVITDQALHFPPGATLRAVGIQSYFRQDIDDDGAYDVSCHAPAAVIAVTGDAARRTVVDKNKCSNCHEWLELHGGSRTFNPQICTMCHNPSLSSSGRTITDPTRRDTDDDIAAAIADGSLDGSVDPMDVLTWPEDSHALKDLVHGIHSGAFRTRHFQHVRGPTREGYYDWSHVTFPAENGVRNCLLCHVDGTFELPLPADLLPTTVRTTSVVDGLDPTVADVQTASENVPNGTDWINTPTAGSCAMCHTSADAFAHMMHNGGLLSNPGLPLSGVWSNRSDFGTTYEACVVCHGPGRVADVRVVHMEHDH